MTTRIRRHAIVLLGLSGALLAAASESAAVSFLADIAEATSSVETGEVATDVSAWLGAGAAGDYSIVLAGDAETPEAAPSVIDAFVTADAIAFRQDEDAP